MSAQIKLVLVKATGKRYVYNGEHRGIVVCKGAVRRAQGASMTHGPDRKFKREMVHIYLADLTEGLARALYDESDDQIPPDPPPPPPVPKLLEWYNDWDGRRRAQLTEHGWKTLEAEGYDAAYDQLGHGWDESILEDAAEDSAAYHWGLTQEGAREGHMIPIREAAADAIYNGMVKALEQCRKEGRIK